MEVTRRDFIKAGGVMGAAAAFFGFPAFRLRTLEAAEDIANPLEAYPNRGWEKLYHDQYRYDRTFKYICSPNDTHACRVMAFVRNGVITRVEQGYDVSRYQDLYGNRATANWHPRMCGKGFTFHRRVYGPYRLRHPIVRRGWKEWAEAGFPALDEAGRRRFKFDARGQDEFVRASWDEVNTLLARAIVAIAKRYSGAEGAKLLREQGYAPEMIDAMEGAGTRTLKFRGGMGLLGVIGKYGMYRLSNLMALVDHHVRGVGPEQARGGRSWSNYTWHGDQAPGHPFVTGLQNVDCDFNDLRFSKLIVQVGKNLVENKMPDSHWFVECMERGAKVVVIAPEYSPPATKADYWLPIRPNSDTALFLGISKVLLDEKLVDETFIKQFTDLPLLVRTDTLARLRASDLFPGYRLKDLTRGPSFQEHGLTAEQREKIGDYVVLDRKTGEPVAVSRDELGKNLAVDPALEGRRRLKLVSGEEVECAPLMELYRVHLRDYDLDSVAEITHCPKDLIQRLARDIGTIRPVGIHQGEGINHWFHATEANRAIFLPLLLTGNVGKPGAGSFGWAGNYKAALFQAAPWSGYGFKAWVAEDPFHPENRDDVDGKEIHVKGYSRDEEPAYWNHGDQPLIVNTPKFGRKVFTGRTHMPTPTKLMMFSNVNLLNNAKWAYEMLKNVNPKVECIVSVDIEMTASIEYSDVALPANSWVEAEVPEITASCSNPFLQIWKGGIPPLFDSRDDVAILAGVAEKVGQAIGDPRCAEYFKFALEKRPEVYIQRLLDASTTTRGYRYADIMAGKHGEPGAALMLFRTYPRIPFWEQLNDNVPFYTPTGRLQAYNDEPEVIEYGENFIVHREGPEATPYLPNVIVSSNPLVRPEDYGIPREHMGWDERTVRNLKLPWSEVKGTRNPLWEAGYSFYLITPKSRHRVHSQWSMEDWHLIWDSNFGDPYRMDKRSPGVGEHQLHINPEAARDLGIEDGDYVYVDSNPADRPYLGWRPDDPFYKVARCMLRARYNPAYPYHTVMMKHAPFIATERSVKAHETRKDGRALSEGTGYQANLRYGSQQSLTRNWHMPMHQLDSLFHKAKVSMSFIFGGEADNHAINTVPKETLVKVMKAEDGGLGGKGVWAPAREGTTPGNERDFMRRYLAGGYVDVKE
jgi:nitrate reductase alpha subunit